MVEVITAYLPALEARGGDQLNIYDAEERGESPFYWDSEAIYAATLT